MLKFLKEGKRERVEWSFEIMRLHTLLEERHNTVLYSTGLYCTVLYCCLGFSSQGQSWPRTCTRNSAKGEARKNWPPLGLLQGCFLSGRKSPHLPLSKVIRVHCSVPVLLVTGVGTKKVWQEYQTTPHDSFCNRQTQWQFGAFIYCRLKRRWAYLAQHDFAQ